MAAFDALTDDINAHLATDASAKRNRLSVQDVALGFVRVANEAMCRPIRNLTEVFNGPAEYFFAILTELLCWTA